MRKYIKKNFGREEPFPAFGDVTMSGSVLKMDVTCCRCKTKYTIQRPRGGPWTSFNFYKHMRQCAPRALPKAAQRITSFMSATSKAQGKFIHQVFICEYAQCFHLLLRRILIQSSLFPAISLERTGSDVEDEPLEMNVEVQIHEGDESGGKAIHRVLIYMLTFSTCCRVRS